MINLQSLSSTSRRLRELGSKVLDMVVARGHYFEQPLTREGVVICTTSGRYRTAFKP